MNVENFRYVLLLAKIDLSICPNTYEFFSIFENPAYGKMFESYLQIVWIDYSETSSV